MVRSMLIALIGFSLLFTSCGDSPTGSSDSGAIKQLNNEMNDLQESIGKSLQPMQTFWLGMKKGALEVGNVLVTPDTYQSLRDFAKSIVTGENYDIISTLRKSDEAANIGGWEGVQLLETQLTKVNEAIIVTEASIKAIKKEVSDATLAQDLKLIRSTEKKLKKEREYLTELKSQKEMIEFRQDRLASNAEKEDIIKLMTSLKSQTGTTKACLRRK